MVTLIKTRLQIKATTPRHLQPPPHLLLNKITLSQIKIATLPITVSHLAAVAVEEEVIIVTVGVQVADLITLIFLRHFH